ncbi:MAG: hypothetical protein ACK5WS_00290 [Alphaproteobacteria bacterium]|jgi:hypothetical protein|nr:hypothetical protein [Candidatus Jidaibacter sp.]
MSKVYNAKEILLKYGLKDILIDRLDKTKQDMLASFAMEHSKDRNLSNMLISLISMESQGKIGAIYLASNMLATVMQLKSLEKSQVNSLTHDHEFHQDARLTIKNLKEMLIASQQEKLFVRSQGLKGEYHIDPKSSQADDFDEDAL